MFSRLCSYFLFKVKIKFFNSIHYNKPPNNPKPPPSKAHTPSLVQTGQQLENLQRQQQLAPAQALQQYAGFINPIATGLPTTIGSQQVSANPLTTALGGAVLGSSIPGVGALLGGGLGLLGGLL